MKDEEKKYGVLTVKEFKDLKLFSAQKDDIYPECYSNASFDFTLGEEFFFPKQYQDALKKVVKDQQLSNTEELPTPKREEILQQQIQSCQANNGILRVPKFSSVVVSTYEEVELPNNVAGRFDLRLKWAMAGLVLQVGTQIEPGYKGRLWGLLHNFSGEEVSIGYHSKEHRLMTAEFYYTCENAPPTTPDKLKKPKTLLELLKKYPVKSGSLQNYFDEFKNIQTSFKEEVQIEIDTVKKSREEFQNTISNKINSELEIINRLKLEVEADKVIAKDLIDKSKDLLDKVTERRNFILTIILAIITFGLAVGLPIVIPFAAEELSSYHGQVKKQNQTIDSLGSKVDTLSNQIINLKDKIEKSEKKRDDSTRR